MLRNTHTVCAERLAQFSSAVMEKCCDRPICRFQIHSNVFRRAACGNSTALAAASILTCAAAYTLKLTCCFNVPARASHRTAQPCIVRCPLVQTVQGRCCGRGLPALFSARSIPIRSTARFSKAAASASSNWTICRCKSCFSP